MSDMILEAERFDAAKHISRDDYHGAVYSDGVYYASCDDLEEVIDDVAYVWACTSGPSISLSIDQISTIIEDELPEGIELDYVWGMDELEIAIDNFNSANKGLLCWTTDYTRAIMVNEVAL